LGRTKWNIKDNSGVKFEDGLPLPYVKYDYGNWIIEFGDNEGNYKVCECFEKSIKNQIEYLKKEFNKVSGENKWDDDFKKGHLGNYYMNWYKRYLDGYFFKPNICHRCNNKTPSIEYCNPMYGGKFKRNFGWYIERRRWEKNFDQETLEKYDEFEKRVKFLLDYRNRQVYKYENNSEIFLQKLKSEPYEMDKERGRLERKMNSIVENLVRGEFGYKPIGEMWVNETILYKLVKEIFPKSEVIHHYRGSELEGLEIDVFIKDKKIGFEYNGLQHYKSIKHFGGKESLKKTKERDKKKIQLCEGLGIELHVIKYDETITKTLIKKRLDNKNNNDII